MVPHKPPHSRQDGLLSGALDEARDRGFVGRAADVAAFARMLSGDDEERVLIVHGPGGIGKSTLLDAFARHAGRMGRHVVRLDARDVAPTATAVASALLERGGAPGAADVVLVDGSELLAPIEQWFWEAFLADRPAHSVTVVAGRARPAPARRLDPGWRRLLRVHELTALDATESDALLAARGVEEGLRAHLARIGRGHPLVLAMLAETARSGVVPNTLTDDPDLAGTLCSMLVDEIPDAAHRTGLATCAHATRSSLDLLTWVIGERAGEVWTWLEALPYVRRGDLGLFLHDVVREIFETEFANRSPDAYVALHRTVRSYFLQHVFDSAEPHPDRAAAQILLLHRRCALSDEIAALREGNLPPISRAHLEDVADVVALIERAEGTAAGALARRWAEEQPEGIYRVRSDDDVDAFAVQCYLPTDGALDHDDPVAAAILGYVADQGALRPGELINVNRYAGASVRYMRDPLLLFVNGVSCILEWSRRPAAWTFIVTVDDAHYGTFFTYLGMRRALEVTVDGLNVVVYGWDRRRFPAELLFELMARRELSGETGPPPPEWTRPVPLSKDEFARAVREALALIGRPDRLGASPLVTSALLLPGLPHPSTSLRDVFQEAIRSIGEEPKGEEHRRVLERTYLRGAPSQEAAAELLDLPFSTYRRHLARAQERLVEVLWSVEVGERRLAASMGSPTGPKVSRE